MSRPPWPTRAIVLAAGFGTRLHPLTQCVPKPLLPLWGRPLIARVLDTLSAWGVRDVLINVHHGADALLAWHRREAPAGLRVEFSFEPAILGTGGLLRRASWFLDDRPFWMVNSDIVFAADPEPLLRRLRDSRALAALWVQPGRGPRTVAVRDGWVRSFASRRPGSPGTATFTGLHLVRPEVVRHAPDPEAFATVVSVYNRARRLGWRIAAEDLPGAYWADVGRPETYVQAHRDTAGAAPPCGFQPLETPRGAIVSGFAAVSPEAVVEPGARLRDAVILGGATVRRGAEVCHAVVGPGADVHGAVTRLAVAADALLRSVESRALKTLGWNPARATATMFDPRGSDRSFARLEQGARRLILIRYGEERHENEGYAAHASFLARHRLPVPAVRHADPAARFLLMEDAGDRSLQDALAGAGSRAIHHLYRRVLADAARWHAPALAAAARRAVKLQPPFDAALYRREHELFETHFLRLHTDAREAEIRAIRRELAAVARRLVRLPRVLVHRDLQSSNIHWTRRGPVFIDFQGMRLGPAMYDVASLLCDPYVSLTADLQRALLGDYAALAGPACGAEEFWTAAVQRLQQALGAYGRLGALPGAERFLDFIPPALRMLRRAVDAAPLDLPALRRRLARALSENAPDSLRQVCRPFIRKEVSE